MDQDIIILLRKYISNRCTRQELEQVRQILASDKYDQEWNAILQEEAENDMADESEIANFNSESVLRKINSTIKPVRKMNVSRWSLGIAASLLLMLSAGYVFWKNQLRPVTDVPQLSLTTTAGQQKKIILTDGTEVILNSGSTLRYTAEFTGVKREVYLDGEAFFNVKHNVAHPFLVHTGRLHIQVLGTSFNVKSYPADARAIVSVASGKVGVNGSKTTGTYMLLPGERLSYNQNNQFKKDYVSRDELLGWQKGMLIFHLETIEEIAPVLERYYSVGIQIKPGHIPNKRVTASFTQKTLPQVLEILSQTAGFDYTMSKNEVHIK